jgi:hypothetical protein
MKLNKKTTTLILITTIFATATAAQTQGPSSNVQATLKNTDPFPLQSGEQGDLRFKIVNKGNTETQVEVKLLDNYPFQVKPGRQKMYELGEVVPGEEYHISTEVLVADDAPDGSNDFKVRIISGDLNRTVNIPVEVQSDDIELNLANLKTQPLQLMPDTENNQISIDIVNNGEKKAENVILNLYTPEFFEETSSFSTRKALGNIKPGERKTASFNLDISESAESGMIRLNTTTSYSTDDSTNTVEKEDSFQLNIEGKPQFEITSVESELKTGTTKQLRMEVKNTGDEKSSSTRIRVMDSSDQPFSYDSSSQYIGTLQPGQTGEAVFEVETEQDAVPKDYLIDFEVRGVKDTEVFVEDQTVEASVSKANQDSGTSPALIAVPIIVIAAIIFYFREEIRGKIRRRD